MIKININDIKMLAIIGTKPEERTTPQKIHVNLSYTYHAEEAINNDDLSLAIDYEKMITKIRTNVQKSNFYLIEKLADFILKLSLEDLKIQNATVEIIKPNATKNTSSVSVTLSASK